MMDEAIKRRMESLGIRESDLEETFAHSSGPGGQNVNKVATAVTLRHLPSRISVTVQDSRSQARNRKLARERLVAASSNENATDAMRRSRCANASAVEIRLGRQR